MLRVSKKPKRKEEETEEGEKRKDMHAAHYLMLVPHLQSGLRGASRPRHTASSSFPQTDLPLFMW